MGFFNRKKIKLGKSYNISEILDILSQKEYQGYTLIEDEKETDKFRIITIEESKKLEKQTRENERIKQEFYNRVQGGGEYRNIKPSTVPNYNNYQNAKKYNPNKWR